MKARNAAAVLALTVLPSAALAEICDYRPSAWIGTGSTVVAGEAATAVAVAGAGAKAAGFYAITNGATGSAMIGSTLAGTSGAGTVGIIGGTSGVIGTVGGIVMAPATIIGAAVVAAGVGGFEGVCYLAD